MPHRPSRGALSLALGALVALTVVGENSDAARSPAAVVPPPPAQAIAERKPVADHEEAAAAAVPPLVCIDPGHSLVEPNIIEEVEVTGPDGRRTIHELAEAEINLDVAYAVVNALRDRFGESAVMMTWGEIDGRPRRWNALRGPASDEEAVVTSRGAFCVEHGARAIVSVHTNWYPDAPNGTLVGYRDANDRALALAVQDRIFEALGADPEGRAIRGFRDYNLDQGDWFLMLDIEEHDVPAIILEPVFMSDAAEARRLLRSIAEAPGGRRAQIARAIAEALGDWMASTLTPGRGGDHD